MQSLKIIGAGLSGCEAAWQAAERGLHVTLYEMRPQQSTGAHQTKNFAELVCSNSFGSKLIDRPSGLLIRELELLNSLLIKTAKLSSIPAGHALAVDRGQFSKRITESIISHPNIEIIHEEIKSIPEGLTVIASGPLTSKPLSNEIAKLSGQDNLFFYDAIAPIIEFDSINMDIAFWGSRYQKGINERGDYINCPLNENEYRLFINKLINAERIELREFEKDIKVGVRAGKGSFFERCLPIEIMAERGADTLAYGPLRPVGLSDPRNLKRPFAVVQLRQDDSDGNYFNLVGFQTNLKYSEQKRVFQMIPGLGQAEFVRLGQMHRNTFINSPQLLNKYLQFSSNSNIFICGQLTGVEGYLANIASGLFTGINAAKKAQKKNLFVFPSITMIGALLIHVTTDSGKAFQPIKANFGLLPPLRRRVKPKKARHLAYSDRSIKEMENLLRKHET